MDNSVATLGDMFISIAVNDLRVWSNNAQFLPVPVVRLTYILMIFIVT